MKNAYQLMQVPVYDAVNKERLLGYYAITRRKYASMALKTVTINREWHPGSRVLSARTIFHFEDREDVREEFIHDCIVKTTTTRRVLTTDAVLPQLRELSLWRDAPCARFQYPTEISPDY